MGKKRNTYKVLVETLKAGELDGFGVNGRIILKLIQKIQG
jgi:hypothetical protein